MTEFETAPAGTLSANIRLLRRKRLTSEYKRKTTHFLGVLAPFFVLLLGFWGAIIFGICYLGIYSIVQYRYNRGKGLLYLDRIVSSIRREHEYKFTSTYLLAVIVLGVGFELLGYRPIAYAAIGVLAIHDGLATIIGLRFGKHTIPYNPQKTIEGSLGGAVAAFPGVIALAYFGCWQTGVPFTSGFLIAVLLGTLTGIIIETLPFKNDNLPIICSSSLVMFAIAVAFI